MTRALLNWMKRNVWVGWFCAIPIWVTIGVWVFDREPPFEILQVKPHTVHLSGVPDTDLGDPPFAQLEATVRRDLDRRCSATMTRHLYTANGYRIDFEGTQRVSHEMIEETERRSPGVMRVALPLPARRMPFGRTVLVGDLEYVCNPTHYLWPIQVRTELPFEIAP